MNQIKKSVNNMKNQVEKEDETSVVETKKSNLDIKSLLIGMLGALSVALIIIIVILLTRKDSDVVIDNGASSMEEAIDNDYVETRLGKEYKDAVADIMKAVEYVRDNNGYVHVFTDEEQYDTYIYNKKGEAFGVGSESTNMTVFRNDGVSIMFTDMIVQTEALDILELVVNSLNAIDNEKIEMYESVSSVANPSDYVGYHEYVAVFDTYDDIRQLYTSVSTEYADSMIEDIKGAFHEGVVPTFKIYYMVSEGGGLTVACHLIENNETYLNWYLDGYLNVYDWELPEEWYTYDFSDAEKSEEMLTELAGSLEEMLTKYATDNDITVTDGSEHDHSTTVDTTSAENLDVSVDENGDKVYTYEGEIDLSKMQNVTLEEAEAILQQSELEDSNIENLDKITEDNN